MTTAQKCFHFITASLQEGKTIYISTAYRITKVTPKTAQKFKDANVELFKIDSIGDLLIRNGKKYVCFCTKNILLTSLTAQ